MKVFICLYFWTIVNAVTVPTVERDYEPSPVTFTINGRKINKSVQKRNNSPLQFYQRPHHQQPVQIPLDLLKHVITQKNNQNPLVDKPEYTSNDWVPVSPRVIVNGKSYQPQLQRNLPTKSVPVLAKVNGRYLPSFNAVQKPLPTPSQENHSRNKFSLPPSKQIAKNTIRPLVVYDPFPPNVYQSPSPSFIGNPSVVDFNQFAVSPTQKTISPIFASSNNHDNSRNERENFFRNFDLNQFLEQQKTLSTDATKYIREPNSNKFSNFFEGTKVLKENYDPENEKRNYSPLVKNYRDKLHELPALDAYERDEEKVEIDREKEEQAPQLNQDSPQDVPTKPIYPGEGEWAKPGKKHKLYIRKNPYETVGETVEKPDGYDTFLKGQVFFNGKKEKFQNQLNQFPVNHKLGEFLAEKVDNQKSDNKNHEQIVESEGDQDEEEEDFVPTKLYAQVRHSEDEEHLPSEEEDDGRLREIVRDSKIQTVYTEEGYEDIGYDHEGHEKLAESDEGFKESDRKLQKAEEKKVPNKKVTKESHGYNKGDELISDEEIEEDKAALGIIEDSDSAGTQYLELPNENESSSSEPRKKKKKNKPRGLGKKKHNKKNFISTKETKTMKTKDNDDGNMEMEITGEVKVIMQPNNSSKSQKFIKKLPTIHRIVEPDLEDEYELARVEEITTETPRQVEKKTKIYIEEVFTEKDSENIITTTPPMDIELLEIPITTRPTTALPKNAEFTLKSHNKLSEIDAGFSKIKSKARRKRFTNDFPEINVDTDFVSKIKHELGAPKADRTFVKYPYYKKFEELGINKNSPLRYAEDMKNIPKKEEGKMAFYDQAESRVACPEIASTVEPIPERVLNAEQNAAETESENDDTDYDEAEAQESQTQEVHEQPKTPRLSGLGDKIDCLKARYFGEDPLDSPFFKEDTVGPVLPIFNQLSVTKNDRSDTISIEEILTVPPDTKSLQSIKSVQVLEPLTKLKKDRLTLNKKGSNDHHSEPDLRRNEMKNQTTPTQPDLTTEISLITTPGYKIDLKPKNIYDQIRLLDYLPDEENNTLKGTPESPTAEKLVIWGSNLLDSVRSPKYYDRVSQENGNRPRRIRIKPKLSKYQSINRPKYIPISHFHSTTTTSTPSPKSFSEVFYKNEIKPNEQMNVFTDILNNIKTSAENEISSEETTVKSVTEKKHKSNFESTPPTPLIRQHENSEGVTQGQSQYFQHNESTKVRKKQYIRSTTTQKSTIGTEKSNSYEVTESSMSHFPDTKIMNVNSKKQFIVIMPSTQKFVPRIEQTTQRLHSENTPHSMNMAVVKGMFPPRTYNTVQTFKRDNAVFEKTQEQDIADKIINKFLVIGMKPPPMQKTSTYSEFMMKQPYRKRKPIKRRNKRSPSRAYSSVSRRRGQEEATDKAITTTEADDDYVPHRPKNYYYDEKLGKIVYLNNNKKEEQAEEVVEEEPVEEHYIEMQEEKQIQKSTTPKQNPIFATATPPPQGQSYIDFVKKLKSASGYHEIPDPLPTEASQQITTTLKPLSTTPPEFLSLLAKLHSNENYKVIEDPDDKKSKKKTTTAAPVDDTVEDEEEEYEEIQQEGKVQNSRNGDITQFGNNFKIFDINEYIPKIKNYLPKTSVDTSKYKTIERPTPVTPSKEEDNSPQEDTRSSQIPSKNPMTPDNSKDTEQKIVIPDSTTEQPRRRLESTISSIPSTTVQTDSSSRRAQIIRTRGRRPTRTTITTPSPESSTEPIQRNSRRRIARPRSRSTTERYLDESEESLPKVLRRRSDSGDNEEREGNSLSRNVEGNNDADTGKEENSREIINEKNVNDHKEDISDTTDDQPVVINGHRQVSKEDVKVFKKYDPNQKHGGNYRSIKDEGSQSKEKLTELQVKPSKKIEDVEIISEFDKSKRHGGNYRSETDGSSDEEVISPANRDDYIDGEEEKSKLDKRSEPLRLNLWEKSLNDDDHSTTTTTSRPELPPSKPKRFKGKIRKKTNNYEKQVSRLTDVVPRPEFFFTDPNLPLAVNMLVDMSVPITEVEKFVTSKENNEQSRTRRPKFNEADSSLQEQLSGRSEKTAEVISELIDSIDEPKASPTIRKPTIIKDPSKRLYFYAPL